MIGSTFQVLPLFVILSEIQTEKCLYKQSKMLSHTMCLCVHSVCIPWLVDIVRSSDCNAANRGWWCVSGLSVHSWPGRTWSVYEEASRLKGEVEINSYSICKSLNLCLCNVKACNTCTYLWAPNANWLLIQLVYSLLLSCYRSVDSN